MHFPGEGTIYLSQNLRFTAPVFTDDTVRVYVEVVEVMEKGRVRLQTRVFRDDDTQVVDGDALVIAARDRS
jgi:acyl dehydratase